MDEADAPAAAQISQADIIERQAETIARLKKQVQKGSEYKQLTKAKLKEAAARLKEYRIRVETLLRAEETLKQQLKTEQTAHAKTKKLHKSTLNQVKAKKHAHAATQTDEKRKVMRTSQTLLSGDVERVNKKTMVDSGVQTVDVAVDTFTSRKRGRTLNQTQMDQMVPKLSRHSPKETLEDTLAINEEPLQLLGGHTTTFPHETSAALDAELAFSDSDAESGETGDTLELNSIVESGENPDLIAFNPSEIDKELEFSEEEEDAETKKRVDSTAETQQKANERADSLLLGRVDAAVQSEIDKELESSSDEEEEVETRRKRTVESSSVERKTIGIGEKTAQFDALDPAIANEIDRDLETSSDEEDSQKTTINAANNGQKTAVRDDDNGRAVMSIDDELDGEFAALESDSEPENGEKKLANGNKHDGDSSSSSSSSDSDSSDGSDSDSDEDGDDLMAGTVDKTPVQIAGNISPGPVEEKGNDQEPSTTDAVVITIPVEEKPVTASEEMYSPVVEAESSSQTLKSLQLDTTAAGINHSEDKEETSAVGSQQTPVQKGIPDPPQPTMTVDGVLVEERSNLGDFLSSSKVQVQISTQHVNVSHDKVFLAHICALHTHLCRSTGQLSRSRVLLFDIVRDNPDIRGLYFAVVMLEIYPAMLEREFDQQCNERPGVLKETLQQAFIVISSTAAAKKELLLHQSSLTMLHRIADAIQKPELELVDGTDRCVQKLYVQKLYDQVKVQDVDYFELAKALEMCTAVYGLDLVSEIFSIERCRELFTSANIEAKSGILSLVGHIATTVAPKTSDTQNPRTRSDQFVESAMDWLYELLSSQTFDKVSEDHFKLLVTCSKMEESTEASVDLEQPDGVEDNEEQTSPTEEQPDEVEANEEQISNDEAATSEVSVDASELEQPLENETVEEEAKEEQISSDEGVSDANQEPTDHVELSVSERFEENEGEDVPVANEDLFAEPHHALDMTSMVDNIPTESPRPSPRQKAVTSFSRGASRFTSFRQGMTRDERLKSMVSQAEAKARKVRLGEGIKSVFQASMDDIGALGIGMQLYFMLTKYLSVAFLCMGIISLPAIMVNAYGHGITSSTVDPLQLAYSSIGNGGVNSDTAATARSCLPIGDIDCTWETVDTPLTSNPKTVTWIVTLTDVLYSFFFLCFLLFYSFRAKKAINEHQNKHLTPARYAVMVRGLPRDATEKEILDHFNNLYDLNKDEEYRKLWFGCCWGRRHKVKRSRTKHAVNRNVVSNVDHLEESTSINKDLYLDTWIAEVSVAHPTGGLLRTYLSSKHLGDKKEEIGALIQTLEAEKSISPMEFKAADEKLIHSSRKKLDKIVRRLEKSQRKIDVIKDILPESDEAMDKKMKNKQSKNSTSKDKIAAAAKAAKLAATNTQQGFNWEACECAFVVFNNLESRRRCLLDYRQSTRWLSRKWQPEELRFREDFPLIVTRAPEPSNILWENLEVTNRGRFYRQLVTNLVTVALLVISCAIISAAQTTQEQFASKAPPEGLCDRALPAVYYGDTSFSYSAQKKAIVWSLAWESNQTCTPGTSGENRYHIAYTNGILNDLDSSKLSYGTIYPNPNRCVDPCISETSTEVCNTLPCFYYQDLVMMEDRACQAYEASHVVYCYCSTQLTTSIKQYGFVNGPKNLWDNIPCRGYTKDYLVKNAFTLLAAGIVVIVNFLLDTILRMFAVFERHTSESTRTIRVAVRMFGAQFLNTALIVIVVNASFGLGSVPVAKELLGGKYRDFERGWYPTVGMGIATTMLLNAFLPQLMLFAQMCIVSPIRHWYKRRSIRTQAKMDKLYAGPTFDISLRYPMVLNSVFVTMVFCGGSPVLLFIAAVTATGIYWFDKLSILYLYSVKTTYDEILGEVTLQVLPWTLALHLGFSAWMYGNAELLKGTMLDLPWLLKSVGLSSVLRDHPDATSDELYSILTDKLEEYDVLGPNGFLVKIVYSHVMLMTVLCFIVTIGLLLYTIFGTIVFVVLGQLWAIIKHALLFPIEQIQALFSKEDEAPKTIDTLQEKEKLPVNMLPEFTEPFLMSVSKKYRPDEGLGYQRRKVDNTYELTCVWPEDTVHENGVERVAGDRKLTWETMQAPVKSYAIEANEKYRHSVNMVLDAWQIVKRARNLEHVPEPVSLGKTLPKLDDQVEIAVIATEITVKHEQELATDDTRPVEAVDIVDIVEEEGEEEAEEEKIEESAASEGEAQDQTED
ncbi:hypothetical protein JG688_00002864 [Phytophthora aleatoria]|uniref:CSC1/OSCA1-like 7TM region domain-containing protein n=1 Tax=Phytophthora aleatoria TaxID=2496075 RepID=A0A8J5J059_9STRA|nr:hypothetical protein JG688_00002864 [Phytophthora aleatoria]